MPDDGSAGGGAGGGGIDDPPIEASMEVADNQQITVKDGDDMEGACHHPPTATTERRSPA